MLQFLKLDGYLQNLDRISEEFKPPFHDQIALKFIKAEFNFWMNRYLMKIKYNALQGIL